MTAILVLSLAALAAADDGPEVAAKLVEKIGRPGITLLTKMVAVAQPADAQAHAAAKILDSTLAADATRYQDIPGLGERLAWLREPVNTASAGLLVSLGQGSKWGLRAIDCLPKLQADSQLPSSKEQLGCFLNSRIAFTARRKGLLKVEVFNKRLARLRAQFDQPEAKAAFDRYRELIRAVATPLRQNRPWDALKAEEQAQAKGFAVVLHELEPSIRALRPNDKPIRGFDLALKKADLLAKGEGASLAVEVNVVTRVSLYIAFVAKAPAPSGAGK